MYIIKAISFTLFLFFVSNMQAQKLKDIKKEAKEAQKDLDCMRDYSDRMQPLNSRMAAYMQNEQYDSALLMNTKIIALACCAKNCESLKEINLTLQASLFSLSNTHGDSALNLYKHLLKKNPDNGSFHLGLAREYYIKGELDSAMYEYNECMRIDPNDASAYAGRGDIYYFRGDFASSIREYEECFKHPYSDAYYIQVIAPLVRIQDFAGAKKYIDRYKRTSWSKQVLVSGKFAYINYYFTAITEAIPAIDYEKALNLMDDAIKGYNTKLTEKIKDNLFYKTIFINFLLTKGYILEMMNRLSEAKDVYEQSLAINPNQPDVKEALANLGKRKQVLILADKTGPVINIISPQPTRSFDIESDDGKTQITGRASDESGIKSVSINGKDIEKVEEDGLFITDMVLKPGPNSITVIAIDVQGNASKKTFTLTGAPVAKKKEPDVPVPVTDATPQYYAILVAEKDYTDPSIPDLKNPVSDARELKAILESQYGFAASHIDTLYNMSREEIMQVIVQRCNTLTSNDNLVIFYAGHGTYERDKFKDVAGYWVPVSAKLKQTATYISANDIKVALKRSEAKHILVIADACFSGAFTRALPGDAGKGVQKQYRVPSRKVMASGNLEPVPDNSKFLYYLKKTLSDNNERYLSAKDLFENFYKALLNNTENLPQYAAIPGIGDEGGEFIFIKK